MRSPVDGTRSRRPYVGSTVVLLVVLALLWGFSCYHFWSSSPEVREFFVGSDDSEPPFFDSGASGGSKESLLPLLASDGDVRAVVAHQKVVDYSSWGTGLKLDIEDPSAGRMFGRKEERLARGRQFEGAAVLSIAAMAHPDGPRLEALLIGRSSERRVAFGWLDLSQPIRTPALVPYSSDAELLDSWMCVGRVVALAGGDGAAVVFLELLPWYHRATERRWIRIELTVQDGRWRPGAWHWVPFPEMARRSTVIPVRSAGLPTEALFLSPTDRGVDLLRLRADGGVQTLNGSAPVPVVAGRAVLERRTMDEALRQRVEFVPLPPPAPSETKPRKNRPALRDRLSEGLADGKTAWLLRPALEGELNVLLVASTTTVEAILLDRPTKQFAWRLPGSDRITIDRLPWVNAIDPEPALLWATHPYSTEPGAWPRWLDSGDLPIEDGSDGRIAGDE